MLAYSMSSSWKIAKMSLYAIDIPQMLPAPKNICLHVVKVINLRAQKNSVFTNVLVQKISSIKRRHNQKCQS